MASKLENFVATIDPRLNLEQVAARADQAMNSFRLNAAVVVRWQDFQELLARFYCHLENAILRVSPPREPHPDFDTGRAIKLLEAEYGSSGVKAAFEMARTGAQGGLYGVLKALAQKMVEHYAGNEISARISHFWDSLSFEEQMEAPLEYIRLYGHLLPSELTEGSAGRIRANFSKVLAEHPRLIQRMRRVGR